MRIFHKLILSFLFITLMIWAVGFFSIWNFQKTREKTIANYSFSVARMVLDEVDEELYSNFIRLSARSKGDRLQRTLEASGQAFEKMASPEESIDREERAWVATSRDQITPFMQALLDLPLSYSFRQEQEMDRRHMGYALFPELFVTNRFGAIAAMSNKTSDYRQNDEAWWRQAWEKGTFFGPIEYDPSLGMYSIALACRVENDRGEPLGVFKGALDLREIEDRLKKSEKNLPFKTGRLALFDTAGRYVFPRKKFGQEAEPFLKPYLAGARADDQKDFQLLEDESGDRHFSVFLKSSGVKGYPVGQWILACTYKEQELFRPTENTKKFVFSVAGVATVIACFLGVFVALSFSRPIERLRRAATQLGKGDFSAKVGIASRDEFGAVARDFERMADRIKSSTTSIERLDHEIEERKMLEKVSLENAEFLQKLMDSIPSPVFYKDISGVYIGCNKAFEDFFGIPQKKLRGKKVADLFPPEVARIYQEKDEELLALPGIQVYEITVRNANNELRDIVFHKATFAGASGEIQGIIGVIMDITLRKKAEEAMKQSMELLAEMTSQIPGIVYQFYARPDGTRGFYYLSQSASQIFPFGPDLSEDFKRFIMLITPEYRDGFVASMEKAIREIHEWKYEWAIQKPTGEMAWFSADATPSLRENEVIFNGIVMDITERKKVEELVKVSEERFLNMLYSAQDAILLIDRETFVDCNQATAKMLGYPTREEFLMKHPSELSPPFQPDGKPSFEKANEMMNLAFQNGFHRFEWMHKKVDGEIFPVEVSLTPVVVHGKNVLHCLWRDLTDYKRIQNQVHQLSQAMEQSPSCAVITDKEGRIEYVNQRFVELTGYSREEVLGQNPRILKSGEHPSEFYKDLWDTILAGEDWQGQFCNRKKNGELYWEMAHIAPLRDEKGAITHFVAMKEDVTYRKQIEEQLRHSLRMEAVGRLAGGIAHDFNNMLTVINGYSGYVLGKMKPEDPVYDKIREIRDAGDCAATIVRQLLNLSRKEAAQPQLLRVSEATGRMKHILNRLLGDTIEMKLTHAEAAGFVKMDPGQLEQIFLNLIVNAREAMPEGGTLTVLTDLVRIEDLHEEMIPRRNRTGDFVRITVADTGAGIDPALRARIFEPFFTTKKRGMNTGLGLSIVYGIIEQVGGGISMESQVGKGTTFRVYLPRAAAESVSRDKTRLEDLPPGHAKLMLVEDEPQVREFALQVLRERGYDVRVARGGEEALAMFDEDPGRKYDLLLTDLTMPKMNGKQLVTLIREKVPELKVIFMSGYSEQAVAGVEGSVFLQKPFSHRALVMKVWDVLGR